MPVIQKCANCIHYDSFCSPKGLGKCLVAVRYRHLLQEQGDSSFKKETTLRDRSSGRRCVYFKDKKWALSKKVAKRIGKDIGVKSRRDLKIHISEYESSWCVYCGKRFPYQEFLEDIERCPVCQLLSVHNSDFIEGLV